jgi:hypothetical protein
VALEPDIVLVDDVEAAQMRQPIGAAKAIGESRRIAVAMAGLVQRQHHITPAGKFDSKAILGLARIDVAVHGQDTGGGGLGGRVRWDVEQGAHGVALGAGKADIPYLNSPRGLRQISEHSASQNQNRAGNRQRPFAMHGSLPFCPDTVEPAFEFVLILIDSLSERRRRASDGCETASRFPIKVKKIH